jgi:hypothetical protein
VEPGQGERQHHIDAAADVEKPCVTSEANTDSPSATATEYESPSFSDVRPPPHLKNPLSVDATSNEVVGSAVNTATHEATDNTIGPGASVKADS